jgi:hypothetical protein
MADVRSIRIRRFKLIEDVALDLAPAIVLVGANNAGKSSILQALHFATSVAQSARLAASANWQGEVYGVGFRPEQLIYTPSGEFWALGFRGRLGERRNTWIEVEIEEADERRCLVAIGAGRNGNVSLRIEGRGLGERIQDISRPYTVYAPGLAGIARTESSLSQGVIRRTVARGDANLVLRNVLLWLFNRGEDWAQFQNDLRQLFPGISLRAEFSDVTDEHIRVNFRGGDLDTWLPLDCAGTSVLQAMQVLAYITLFKPQLFLLDEPDSHMHPNNQVALCRLLLQLARDRGFQVMIATHSRHVFSAMRNEVPIKWVSQGRVVDGVSTDDTARLLDIGALDSLDFLGNPQLACMVLTEDTDKTMIASLLKTACFNMAQTLVLSYRGCSKVDAVLVISALMREKAPHVRVVVHRDSDYFDEDEARRYTEQITAAGCTVFLTEPSDIEGYFLDPRNLHALYPQVGINRAAEIIDDAIESTGEESISEIINVRHQLALRRRVEGGGQPNVGEIARIAREEYQANPRLMCRGKRALSRVRLLMQQELGAHASVDVASPVLVAARLREIAESLWPHA